jgi:3-oxoadipate enol-lactonase
MADNFERSGLAPVKAGQVYYEVAGSGPPLVLIHASCADHTMWDEQVKVFAPHFQVVRYDRRGFGKTTASQLENDENFFDAQDLDDLLQYLGVEKAYVLGLSGGGSIAVDFSLAFAGKVAALILCSAGYSGAEMQATPEEMVQFGEYIKQLQAKNWEQVSRLDAKVCVDGPSREEEPSRQAIREKVYRWLYDSYLRNQKETDPKPINPPAAGRLGEIKVLTLVMWGDKDLSGLLTICETMASTIKGAQKIVFKDTAHMLNLERPDEFNQAVLKFLQEL